ncbi:DUF6918 family protein [Egbenema bharatensis]|uniref:DUF6918 family protein n=1 Tax=Egbenema bharatensis TaxID=3463334 RepID=UPI003A84E222
MALYETLGNQDLRASLVADCVKLIDEQVAAKNGISGLALKATYGVVKGVGAGYIPGAIDRLLPEVFAALEPMWDEGKQAGDPVAHLTQNRTRTADVLLSVTDTKIEKTDNGIVRASYNKLRKSVKGDVEEAVPGLAQIIGTHATEPVQK